MKIILLNDVAKLGKRYDVKDVSNGHALNLLIPQGHAIAATREAVKRFSVEKAKMEGERKVHEELLNQNIKSLEGVTLTISGKANEKGHLFAGIHRDEIAKELAAQSRIQIDPTCIQLEHPLKTIGEHIVEAKAAGKSVTFRVTVLNNSTKEPLKN